MLTPAQLPASARGMWLLGAGKHGAEPRAVRPGGMLRRRTFTSYGFNMDTTLLAAVIVALWSCVAGMEYPHDEPEKVFMNDHVCEEVRYINRTVLRRTAYMCKVREQVRCTNWFKHDMCTNYRTRICYRNVSVVVPDVVSERVCCPGWTEDDNGSCMQPLCPDGCENGGVCGTDPSDDNVTRCLCTGGLTGNRCETDIDECTSRNDTCSHACGNTFGSYFCACFAGNVLAPDGVTCLTNNSADNGTLPVAPLHDQRANDAIPVMLGSLLGGAAVVMLMLLCALVAVARVRRKRPSLDERMDASHNSTQNNYIGLSDFDRVDDTVQVLAGGTGVQESSTPAVVSRFDVANEYVIDGKYASHLYEDADVDGAAACARTDDRQRDPGKSNPAGALTYDYAYGLAPAIKTDDTAEGKPGSDHYECVATSSPYDYAYGATFDRQATRKVRLPETKDGYLTPVCVCPSQPVDRDATAVPSEYLHCDDGAGASVYENSVHAVNANHRTTHGEEKQPDTVADGGYLTTEGAHEGGYDAVYQNTHPSHMHCSSDSADSGCEKEQPKSSSDNVYMLPVPRPKKPHIDSTNGVEPDVYVKCDGINADESIYCNTLPDTQPTLTHDITGDTQMGSNCSSFSKTDDTGLDDSDYVSGDVNRDSADYENWDSPMRDALVYENCQV